MSRLFGAAIPGLETAMRFRLTRQAALASNVANADTPNYRRIDVSFDRELLQAGASLQATHPQHVQETSMPGLRFHRSGPGSRPDGNAVDRDQEVLAMTRNAGAFQDSAFILARIYAMRRMAVTGEL